MKKNIFKKWSPLFLLVGNSAANHNYESNTRPASRAGSEGPTSLQKGLEPSMIKKIIISIYV